MNSTKFEILSVRPASDDATYLAQVSFAFRPSEFEPLRIVRNVERDGDWKTYTDAEIDNASMVRIRSAFLRRSKKGELYVQANCVDVPWSISRAVGEEAFQRLDGEKA